MKIEIIYLERDNDMIETKNYEDLYQLKNYFYNFFNIPQKKQLWFSDNKVLEENIKISNMNKLGIFIKDNLLTLKLRLLNNEIDSLPLINKNILIKNLIKIIEDKYNLTNIVVSLNNVQIMNKDKKLNYYNMNNNNIIHIKKNTIIMTSDKSF